MAHELADFRAFFPELAAVADAVVTAQLTRAEAFLIQGAWGSCYDEAVLLFAAHRVALDQNRQAVAKTINGAVVVQEGAGVINSASVGNISVGYAAPSHAVSGSKSDTWLSKTPYGVEYLALRDSCIIGIRKAGLVRNEFTAGR